MEIKVDRWHEILRGIWLVRYFPFLQTHLFLYFLIVLAVVSLLIWALRKSHAAEIYIIWLFFTFFLVLFYLLDSFPLNLPAIGIVSDIYDTLDDADFEAKLVFVAFVLLIVPQVLTYFLSGLSGSASRPMLVSDITNAGLWSLVKFLAAFSGIVTATSLHSDDPWSTTTGTFMLIPLVAAFFLVWVRHVSGLAIAYLYQKEIFAPFRWIHEKFTKYREPEDKNALTIKEQMRKEVIDTIREGMREGVREGVQELMRESGKLQELIRKTEISDVIDVASDVAKGS